MSKDILKRIIGISIVTMGVLLVAFIYMSDSDSNPNTSTKELSGTIPVYTPGSGGILYILNAGLTSLVNNSNDLENAKLATEGVNGADEIISLSLDKSKKNEPFFGSIAEPSIYQVYEGTNENFSGEHPDLRSVSKTGYAAVHLIVPSGSSIETYADLKGKKIGVDAGSAQEQFLRDLLAEGYGLKEEKDYEFLPIGYEEVKQGMQDNSIDAGVLMGPVPAPLVEETAQTTDVRVLSVGKKEQQKIEKEYPYYNFMTIDTDTYKKQNTEITIGSFDTITYTDKNTPDELVKSYLRPIIEEHDEFSEIHASAKSINKETVGEDLLIPLHSGAKEYYEEQDIEY